MERLSIERTKVSSLSPLAEHESLKMLEIADSDIDDYADIRRIPNLRHLQVSKLSSRHAEDVSHALNLSWLTAQLFEEDGLKFLSRLPHLEMLVLSQGVITNKGYLPALYSLTSLFLIKCVIQQSENCSFPPNIRQLNFYSCKLNSVEKLSQLSSLVGLEMTDCELDSLERLSELSSLTDLAMRRMKIKDIGFLASMVNLKKLTLSNNKILDIRVIKDLTELEFLSLSYNPVADIEALVFLPHLETLYLRSTDVSHDSILKFQQDRKAHGLNVPKIDILENF